MPNIDGVRGIINGLRERRARHVRNLRVGLLRAGLMLQGESQEIVPVDTGNLRASAFTMEEIGPQQSNNIVILVGYEASYAIYVHEILDNWHAPGTYAKFLEWPAHYLRHEMRAIVREALEGK